MSVIAICFCSFGPKLNWTISSAINLATVQSSEKSQKTFLDRFWERLAEILRHSAILGWAAEHFESDFRNLAGMFYTTL